MHSADWNWPMRPHNRTGSRVAIAAVLTLCAAACQAKEPSVQPQQVLQPTQNAVGLWRLRPVDATGSCQLVLSPPSSGFAVLVERCDLPKMSVAATWRPSDTGFELVDAAGGILLTFRWTGPDDFSATGPDQVRYRLSRAPEA